MHYGAVHCYCVLLLSPSSGPAMTMQRLKIKEKYAETIDALYADTNTDEAAK